MCRVKSQRAPVSLNYTPLSKLNFLRYFDQAQFPSLRGGGRGGFDCTKGKRKKGNVINRNFSPIIYKKSKNQLTHSLPEKWLKLRLNFLFERQKQIANNKVNNCLLEDSAAVQIR